MKVLLLLALALPIAAQRYQSVSAVSDGHELVSLLDSEGIRVTIAPHRGAELFSVQVLFRGSWRELLYSSTEGWTGRAPWLWPATGRNFPKDIAPNEDATGSSYDYKGKRYPMPIHGFAKDMAWTRKSLQSTSSGARAILTLADTPATREMYPFGWNLELEYLLANGELAMEMRVKASEKNEDEMFFSAGNHITFRLPLVEGSDRMKTTLQSPSTIEYLKDGFMPTGKKRPNSLGVASALSTMPVKQAVTLGGYTGGRWMTLTDPAGLAVLLEHSASQLPREACVFNMWGDAPGGYFSPEPWVGLQNSLVSGDGLVKLRPGAEWTWRLKLSYLDLARSRSRELPAR
jgi:galactose mutarotase-like enzyme